MIKAPLACPLQRALFETHPHNRICQRSTPGFNGLGFTRRQRLRCHPPSAAYHSRIVWMANHASKTMRYDNLWSNAYQAPYAQLSATPLSLWIYAIPLQTDPNWANFLYDHDSRVLSCIDFGALREYSKCVKLKVLLPSFSTQILPITALYHTYHDSCSCGCWWLMQRIRTRILAACSFSSKQRQR